MYYGALYLLLCSVEVLVYKTTMYRNESGSSFVALVSFSISSVSFLRHIMRAVLELRLHTTEMIEMLCRSHSSSKEISGRT